MSPAIPLFALISIVTLGFSIYEITTRHLLASGTFLQRLWIGVRTSAVTALSHAVAVVSSFVLLVPQYANDFISGAAGFVAGLLGDPALKAQILAVVPEGKMAIVTLALSIAFYWARRRTQGSAPT